LLVTPLQLPLEAVLAGILPLIGITGDIAFDGAEAVVGPVIIATMLLPYLVAPPLVREIRAEGERAAGSYRGKMGLTRSSGDRSTRLATGSHWLGPRGDFPMPSHPPGPGPIFTRWSSAWPWTS